jgi:hypothetical protein
MNLQVPGKEYIVQRTASIVHTAHHREIDVARISVLPNTLSEIHVKEDEVLNTVNIRAMLQARAELRPGGRGPLLFVVPGHPAWDVNTLRSNVFEGHEQSITALGVYLEDHVLATAARMFFSLFPPPFPVKLLDDEEALRSWLLEL